jgi:hypothetical protein
MVQIQSSVTTMTATVAEINMDILGKILLQVASGGNYGLYAFNLGCRRFNEACKDFNGLWLKTEEARLRQILRDGLMTMMRHRKAIVHHKNTLKTEYVEGQQIPIFKWNEEFILKPIKLGYDEYRYRRQFLSTLKQHTVKLRTAIVGVKRKTRDEASSLIRQTLEDEKAKVRKRIKTLQKN